MGDEFRKPYEYEEEKVGGFLLVFVARLITADLFLTIMLSVQVNNALKSTPPAGAVVLVLGAAVILFNLFTAITCYKGKKHAVKTAKIFLVIRTIFMTASLIPIFITECNNKYLIGPGPSQYRSVTELILLVFVMPLLYVFAFGIGWYLYLLKSKKCAALVEKQHT